MPGYAAVGVRAEVPAPEPTVLATSVLSVFPSLIAAPSCKDHRKAPERRWAESGSGPGSPDPADQTKGGGHHGWRVRTPASRAAAPVVLTVGSRPGRLGGWVLGHMPGLLLGALPGPFPDNIGAGSLALPMSPGPTCSPGPRLPGPASGLCTYCPPPPCGMRLSLNSPPPPCSFITSTPGQAVPTPAPPLGVDSSLTCPPWLTHTSRLRCVV